MARSSLASLEAKVQALPEGVRDRVLERAAILGESGVDDEESTRLAYAMETTERSASVLPGVARAEPRATKHEREAAGGD